MTDDHKPLRVRMIPMLATAFLFALGCGGATGGTGADIVTDTATDTVTDIETDTVTDIETDAVTDIEIDTDIVQPGEDVLIDPLNGLMVQAERIHSSSTGHTTPPTWNAHLPKLAMDEHFVYAVHAEPASAVGDRQASILRRGIAGGPWEVQAVVTQPHQPPSIIMDVAGRMHLVFACAQDEGEDAVCFQGGAGTAGVSNRFYHLIFSLKMSDDGFDFSSYANHNEFATAVNGYMGLGTTADGTTWWSVADTSWARHLQQWSSASSHGTFDILSVAGRHLLYPIHAAHPDTGSEGLTLFTGMYDPEGGTNAGYPASALYTGDLSGVEQRWLGEPDTESGAGTVGSFPSAVAYDLDGTLLLLAYRLQDSGDCTELVRFDDGLFEDPSVYSVGCLSTYAKLRVGSDGTLYILEAASSGAVFTVGASTDDGETWTWTDVPIMGLPDTEDVRFFGGTPLELWHAPNAYVADKWLFLFSGVDATGLARHSYLGELDLTR